MENRNIVVGTAGHVDHGKSTLIKALSGIETDTMEEELKRGLSINLGFAYMDLPDGTQVGIVDVPGHEKFIKNMLAGAPGIDLVLLVVDVNEGVMPQTTEHAAILSLLGIDNFIIVLTKVDGADPTLKEIVYEDIRDQFQGTILENATIIETDAVSGIGLNDLRKEIQEQSEIINTGREKLPARLNVDRSFSVKGFGTVVTGTLMDGTLHVGDDITIYPKGIETKVRTIQIHKKDAETAYAGNRTALNLTKVQLEDVERGDILSAAPLTRSFMLDAKVQCLRDSPFSIELWDRVHVHIGTQEVLARLVPIGQEQINPSETGYMQLRLEEQVSVKKGDRFIIRSFSPVFTIGGGVILDENPDKHRRFNEEVIESLQVKETGDLSKILMDFMDKRSYGLTNQKDMANYLNVEVDQVKDTINELVEDDQLEVFGHLYISKNRLQDFENEVEHILTSYHKEFPVREGMPLEEFRSKFKAITPKELDTLTKDLIGNNRIILENNTVRLASFNPELKGENAEIKNDINTKMEEAGFTPPSFEEITENNQKREEIFNSMIGKEIFQLGRHVYLHQNVYDEAKQRVIDYINDQGEISLAEFRDMMNTSRKYSIMMLEHLDDIGLTKRIEDTRVLRNQ